MRRAALGAAFVTTALVSIPSTSAAQPAASPASEAASAGEEVSLSYESSAPADCPTEVDFRAEVSKLTSKARFSDAPSARRIRIELQARGHEVLGRLVTGDGKQQSSREVRGKDCREVSSALAIAVALTIDPDALQPAEPDPPEPVEKPPEPPPRPPAEPRPQRPPQGVKPQPAPTQLRWGLGAGLTLQSAWAPHMRPGAHAYAVLGVGERFRMHLGGAYFPAREDNDVTFGAWLGQGGLSWNLALLGILRPYAALTYEAGAVEASGTGLTTTVEAQRPWQALSAGLGLRFETENVFLQIGGNFLVPISRQRYLISDTFGRLSVSFENPRFGLKQETSLGVFL